jgi:hypothetical protein
MSIKQNLLEICFQTNEILDETKFTFLTIRYRCEDNQPYEYIGYIYDSYFNKLMKFFETYEIKYTIKHILNSKIHKHLFRDKEILKLIGINIVDLNYEQEEIKLIPYVKPKKARNQFKN